jgi:hypothetical protein
MLMTVEPTDRALAGWQPFDRTWLTQHYHGEDTLHLVEVRGG